MPTNTQLSYAGGTQIKTSKFLPKSTELALAQNVRPFGIGTWITRDGTTQKGDDVGTAEVRGLFGLSQKSGESLYASTGTSVKILSGTSWNSIGGITTPADCDINIIPFLDQSYIIGANSSDEYLTTGTLSGSTYGEDSTIPKARYGVVYFDRLYLIDCEWDGTRYSSRAYYSSIPTATGGVYSITFTPTVNFLQVQTDDGDVLMGGAQSYGRLMLFKKYSLHAWDLTDLRQVESVGTTSPRSIVNLNNNVMYFHFSAKRKGWYLWDGTGSRNMSRAIEPFIKGMDSDYVPYVASGVFEDSAFLFINDVTLDADVADYYGIPQSYTNVMIEYSFADSIFIIHTLPYDARVFTNYDNKLFIGDENGKVYEWNSGTTDNGTAIESVIVTHNFYGIELPEYNQRKVWENNIVNMHKPSTAKVFIMVDNGDPIELGQCKNKVNYFGLGATKGYGIKTKITSNSKKFIFEGNEYSYQAEGNLEK